MDEPTKIISFRATPEFDRLLRIEAAKVDLDRSAYIRAALREKMSRDGAKIEDDENANRVPD